MNNVLEDSLFVSQNKKFDEIQSIVRQFSAAIPLSRIMSLPLYRTMPERKKSRWKCFVTRFMMMNYGR